MADTLSTISVVSFALAGILFLVAVFVWIKCKIPEVFGDLSGKTAKKTIAKMRIENEKTGVKSFKPSTSNINRGKITELMNPSQALGNKALENQTETQLLQENQIETNQIETEQIQENAYETQLLKTDTNETDILSPYETDILIPYETEVLNQEETGILDMPYEEDSDFKILDEIIFIHTKEVIL